MLNKTRVFLSGGFKTNWQQRVIEQLGEESFTFFNPNDHGLEDASEYTTWDVHYVRNCDILFAYMEASNPSGFGLMFELGMAYGLNKTIILVDERSEVDPTFARYFKIAHKPSGAVFNSLDEGITFLQKFSLNTVYKSYK